MVPTEDKNLISTISIVFLFYFNAFRLFRKCHENLLLKSKFGWTPNDIRTEKISRFLE